MLSIAWHARHATPLSGGSQVSNQHLCHARSAAWMASGHNCELPVGLTPARLQSRRSSTSSLGPEPSVARPHGVVPLYCVIACSPDVTAMAPAPNRVRIRTYPLGLRLCAQCCSKAQSQLAGSGDLAAVQGPHLWTLPPQLTDRPRAQAKVSADVHSRASSLGPIKR
jgi:hypothetical protein